jgi:hypothetical protein
MRVAKSEIEEEEEFAKTGELDVLPGAGYVGKYSHEFATMAYRYCLLGATNAELGDAFGVKPATIVFWMERHPGFENAVKAGRLDADAAVVKSLFKRAKGFQRGDRYFPPDTASIVFWLKNRQPQHWRDKVEIDHNHSGEVEIQASVAFRGERSALDAYKQLLSGQDVNIVDVDAQPVALKPGTDDAAGEAAGRDADGEGEWK